MEFNTFDSIKIGLASPEQIRKWSYGAVTRPETINYRTQKPEKDGLFCERIFGPTKDWECHCGKFKKIRFKGKICDRCGVEVTRAKVRRERMGHIELAAPVSHIWYFKGTPSRIGQVLEIPQKKLEEVLYFTKYIVTDPGETDLVKKQIVNEAEYNAAIEKFGPGSFKAEMGAEAIQKLLREYDPEKYDIFKNRLVEKGMVKLPGDRRKVTCTHSPLTCDCEECGAFSGLDVEFRSNLEVVSDDLKEELSQVSTGQKRIKLLKRLEIIEAFRVSGNKPEWMVLNVVPVIPPDIRPMVMLDGGRYATSDLNDLYRRVINRNNRLERMLELNAPEIIIRNEKRMLQEAVDALIDNGRHGRPVTGPNNRALKSLSDMLKGKQGRFRQNLLGKRVDYSGRSVIVVGPELKMYQCGVPKEMALELFKPFVLKKIVDSKVDGVANIKSARKIVEQAKPVVWDALETVIKDHPVLLNRAPTLHRLGIQAFEPVLVEGRAIKLHPLSCGAFNADFDGDQMAIHLPLSAEAQAEARFLMLAANNLLKPSDGSPVAVPSQDMVLGSYYLTLVKPGEKGEGKYFRDVDEALMAYQAGEVGLHAEIHVRITKEIGGKTISKIIDCTVGRLIFNENIPQDLGYVDRTNSDRQFDLEVSFLVGKKQISDIIERCIAAHGTTTTSEVLDKIKATGYKYSTISGLTVAVCDATIPKEKQELLAKADEMISEVNMEYDYGYISEAEKSKRVISIWNTTTNDVTEALKAGLDRFNPIFMMADSGARGSISQIRQLAGMRGLIANTSGTTIEIPIRSNYREGLNILEYFISSRGARKGLADTALRTANSGYLTRRLVDVSQDVIVYEDDCGTEDGIMISEIANGKEVIETLEERLVGRFLTKDLKDPVTAELIQSKDKLITKADSKRICATGIKEIAIRSVLECKCTRGVCAKCYGSNLTNGNVVTVGEAVGVIAAQSIGEPGTQLTMRTFHTGGVASAEAQDITQGLPRVEELFESRHLKNAAIMTKIDGRVHIEEVKNMKEVIVTNQETGESESYPIHYNYKLSVTEGSMVKRGDRLTEGNFYPGDILNTLGVEAVQNYVISEVQKVYRLQGVDINDKHIEVIVRQMLRKVKIDDPGSSYLLPGTVVEAKDIYLINKELKERKENGEPDISLVTTTPILLGITKASSSSDSFLSAASFQETTRALTDAALRGKSDYLVGLKENVLIGKLIPAGTGVERYTKVRIEKTAEPAAQSGAAASTSSAVSSVREISDFISGEHRID